MRALVLNTDYSLLNVTSNWFDSLCLLAKGAVQPLALYERKAKSERHEHPIPAVAIVRDYARVGRRRHGFTLPSHRNVFVRDGGRCAYCNAKLTLKQVTKDHVVPKAKGGRDDLLNVVASCRSCNGHKADRTLGDSGMTLRSDIELRHLTDDEKLRSLLIYHDATERAAWLGWLKSSGHSLF